MTEMLTQQILICNSDYQSIGWVSGIFKSFEMRLTVLKEEIKELCWAEYSYQDSFVRLDILMKVQKARRFFSRAGFKYTSVNIDVFVFSVKS
jgi:hypothetical protein